MTPDARPADTRRLYQLVADQIRGVMEEGGFTPGTRLPPERELASQLGVSRASLREALIALEIEGRVEIRMGSGIYVCAPPAAGPAEPLALGESPSELMQARSVLEGGVVTLAVARATTQGLGQVQACLEAMRRDVRAGRSPMEADRRFHVAIAEMTGNTVLVRMVGELFDERHGAISSRMSRRAESARTWLVALHEHESIYRALQARDPLDAAAAMLGHLGASRQRWIGQGSPSVPTG